MPGKIIRFLWKQKILQPQLSRPLQIEIFTVKEVGHRTKQSDGSRSGLKADAVAIQYLPVLRFSEAFSSPCVDERYLAEVTRAFGSLALGTFRAKQYTFSLIAENIPPR
jgi:hypothetical protein